MNLVTERHFLNKSHFSKDLKCFLYLALSPSRTTEIKDEKQSKLIKLNFHEAKNDILYLRHGGPSFLL